jgi:predicted AlkP superfamily phosphohydrolase/phosphomutase
MGALKEELRQALEALVDPANQERPIRRVFDADKVYSGPYLSTGPDLVIGYNPGYRISKSAARGEVGSTVFEDNTSPWCGDHCLDPETVPGVLYCNRSLKTEADIRDLAPTIMEWFGVTPPSFVEGKSLL